MCACIGPGPEANPNPQLDPEDQRDHRDLEDKRSRRDTRTIAVDAATRNSPTSASTALHGLFTVGSFAPSIIGSTFAVLDAGLYALEGDYTQAGIAVAAAAAGVVASAGAVKLGVMAARRISGRVRSLNPLDIRFSQSSVNGTADLANNMSRSGWNGSPIDVVKMADGQLTTVDNTRTLAASRAGINVKARVHNSSDSISSELAERFSGPNGTPSTWGEAVANRISSQKKSFRDAHPSGSHFTGSVD